MSDEGDSFSLIGKPTLYTTLQFRALKNGGNTTAIGYCYTVNHKFQKNKAFPEENIASIPSISKFL